MREIHNNNIDNNNSNNTSLTENYSRMNEDTTNANVTSSNREAGVFRNNNSSNSMNESSSSSSSSSESRISTFAVSSWEMSTKALWDKSSATKTEILSLVHKLRQRRGGAPSEVEVDIERRIVKFRCLSVQNNTHPPHSAFKWGWHRERMSSSFKGPKVLVSSWFFSKQKN